MFNLFKKSERNTVAIAQPKANLKGKTTKQIIEEIHESFYTEVDKLLAEAKVSHSLQTDKQDLIDKSKRLEELGFHNTKECQDAYKEIIRLKRLEEANEQKQSLLKAINYYSHKYPNYKFITEESVKNICSKYNLVYGEVERYIGTVPDKNLKHMEDFKIDENDECYIEGTLGYNLYSRNWEYLLKRYKTFEQWSKEQELMRSLEHTKKDNTRLKVDVKDIFKKCPLEIAAPITDFDMKGMEVVDNRLVAEPIPDPIVLKPVIFESQKYYLIVTALGLEASDELVVNQKMN